MLSSYSLNDRRSAWGLSLCLSLLISSTSYATSNSVGEVEFSRGTVAAEKKDQPARMLGKGESIFRGDNIQTSVRSFAILAFEDNAKVTVRPNSSLSVDEYLSEGDTPSAKLRLHRGGVKATSGSIGKKDPKQFLIHTPQAIVYASQADYSVRLCGEDCAAESKELKPIDLDTNKKVIGRIVEMNGSATAKSLGANEKLRSLSLGSAVYRTDNISTGVNSSLMLVFRDGGRVTLDASSVFDISNYEYQSENASDVASYNLVKGGLRALTGLIGKQDKEAYEINTPVATIGIRGTGFDLKCQGDCVNDSVDEKLLQTGKEDGLFSHVWNSAINQSNDAGKFKLNQGKANFIANKNSPPIDFKTVPPFFLNSNLKRPDKKDVDMDELFGAQGEDGVPPGLYVEVDGGHVEIWPLKNGKIYTDKPIYLGSGETGYVNEDGSIAIRLTKVMNFQFLDPYPDPSNFDSDNAEFAFSLLTGETTLTADGIYECICD